VSNVGYATLQIIPSAKDFASKLGGEVDGPIGGKGKAAGAALGGGIFAAASKFAAPLAGVFAIGGLISTAYGELADAERLNAQLAAGIASTGNAANVSVQGMNDLASSIQLMSGQTDDSISEAQALLLTFTNIKNVGADKIFDQATLAAANMAARLGGDAAGSATMLGKALNDPVAGITSLSRAGVQFTDQQKEQIKTMVAAGDTLGAQKLILGELENQFGGSAEAAGKTLPGSIEILKRSFEDLLQMLAGRATPGLANFISLLSSGLQAATPAIEGALDTVSSLVGGVVDVVSGMWTGIGYDTSGMGAMAEPIEAIGTTIFGILDSIMAAVGPFIPAIIASFSSLVGPILQLVPALSPVGLIFQALLPVLPQVAALVAQLAAALGGALAAVLPLIVPLVAQLVSVLSGVFVAILPVVATLVGVLATALGTIIPAVLPLVTAILPILATLIGALVPIISALMPVLGLVAGLFGALVGAIAPLITTIVGILIPVIQALLPIVTTVFGVIASVITSAMQIVQGIIQVVTGIISGDWSAVWAGIQNIAAGVWNTIVSLISGAINIVRSVISSVLAAIGSIFSGAWNGLVGIAASAWNGITSAVSTGVGNAVRFVSGLPGQIMSALSGLGGMLTSVGTNMMSGFINGAKSMAGRIAEAVLAPIRNSVEGVKNFLGIHSPSRLMRGFGRFTGEGYALGLEGTAGLIERASRVLAPTMPPVPSVDSLVAPGGVAGSVAALAAASGSGRPTVEQHIHPTPGMSEETVAELALRKLARAGGAL
jgi:phage-related protein